MQYSLIHLVLWTRFSGVIYNHLHTTYVYHNVCCICTEHWEMAGNGQGAAGNDWECRLWRRRYSGHVIFKSQKYWT